METGKAEPSTTQKHLVLLSPLTSSPLVPSRSPLPLKITPILFLVEKLPANVRGPLDESDLPVDMREPLDPLRLALAPGGAPSPLPPPKLSRRPSRYTDVPLALLLDLVIVVVDLPRPSPTSRPLLLPPSLPTSLSLSFPFPPYFPRPSLLPVPSIISSSIPPRPSPTSSLPNPGGNGG